MYMEYIWKYVGNLEASTVAIQPVLVSPNSIDHWMYNKKVFAIN